MTTAGGSIHLVGSVPLPDAETVFRTVSGALNPFLPRITDGETGRRGRWIWFQREMLLEHPDMEVDTDEPPYALYQWDGQLLRETPFIRFKTGIDPASAEFPTGYAEAGPGVVRTVHTVAGRWHHRTGHPVPGVSAHADGDGVHVRQPECAGRLRTRVRTLAAVCIGRHCRVGAS